MLPSAGQLLFTTGSWQRFAAADGSTSRQRTKELIARLEKDYPDLKSKVMGAVERAGIAHWDAV